MGTASSTMTPEVASREGLWSAYRRVRDHSREMVDRRIGRLIEHIADDRLDDLERLLVVGMQHEQQHQELFYTEIKYILGENPPALRPVYRPRDEQRGDGRPSPDVENGDPGPMRFVAIGGGLLEFGNLEGGWCWDNELPVHKFRFTGIRLARDA